ncbi:type IV pilus biogenesis/stability protein PilW [Pseudocolwellia agarivorans]|uniref:type IV pilus biogenesis/stability protein PilW n=1 Tax=Pseudocolwellia agarivorans TaxID=1911682 RepID=UPI000985887D|nr:type IV pilus biogenesis/stability protein PilW [Pseudocolwellia agarivorans]
MPKIYQIITVGVLSSLLSACVTQNYENNAENPVTERNSTDNEIAMTRISLGMGYLNMGNTTQAKLNLEKAKRFAPNLTQVYTAFAHYYDVVDEPEQAITAFEKALSLDADDADTLNNYGVFLCKREKYDESEKYMLKAIAVPSYLLVSQSYENLALCQLEAKNFEKAEMYLAKSISHSPSSASALLQMLRLQYAMGKYDEAIAYLRRYEKSTRRFTPNALALAYKVYEKMNNRGIAKNYASLLVKMFPNSYEAKQYILNGLQHVEADDLASKFLLLNKKNSDKPKKRTMVLSPNKKSGISLSSKRKIANKSLNNKGSESVKLATKKQVTTTNANVKNDIVAANDKATNINKTKQEATTTSKEGVTGDKNIEKTAKKLLDTSPKEDVLAQSSIDDDGNKMLTLPIHVIVKGDSLFSISKRYNIKMQQIERWNGFKRSKILKVGDVIYLADPKKALKR